MQLAPKGLVCKRRNHITKEIGRAFLIDYLELISDNCCGLVLENLRAGSQGKREKEPRQSVAGAKRGCGKRKRL